MQYKTWEDVIKEEQEKPYYKSLMSFLDKEYASGIVYPPRHLIYNALCQTPLESVKCVILGQDPYHGAGQAMGLSFSVNKGVTIPRSLKNIYKELQFEFGYDIPTHGDLSSWAKQGVLLLNTVLTVRNGEANSHRKQGWEQFTDAILCAVNQKEDPVVFMLWGNQSIDKKPLLTNPNHLILEAPHPSPFAARKGFFGCNHFITCNNFLRSKSISQINWEIQ